MIYIKKLTKEEVITLSEMHKHHPLHLTRKRAHSLLLSHKGISVPMICEVYDVCRQTVYSWFSKWEARGICGLLDQAGRGRPKKLDIDQQSIVERVQQSPRSLKSVLSDLETDLEVTLSIDTLKRLCKKAGLVWKRTRKSLKKKRNPAHFEQAKNELAILIEQHKKGVMNLSYFDESSFNLTPKVPYAWQPIGETIEIPSSASKAFNVLGFIDRDGQFASFVFEGSINTAVVVATIDAYSKQINKPTTLVIDNASTHTSNEFNENVEKWKKRGLTIYRIPPYSPELNVIEIVWRKIKYKWMPFSAYGSRHALKEELFNILKNIGSTFKVEFS